MVTIFPGIVVVFTGKSPIKRDELRELCARAQVRTHPRVTVLVDMLVCGDGDWDSAKHRTARAIGVPEVPDRDFLEALRRYEPDVDDELESRGI